MTWCIHGFLSFLLEIPLISLQSLRLLDVSADLYLIFGLFDPDAPAWLRGRASHSYTRHEKVDSSNLFVGTSLFDRLM